MVLSTANTLTIFLGSLNEIAALLEVLVEVLLAAVAVEGDLSFDVLQLKPIAGQMSRL